VHQLTGHKWFCSAPMSDAFLVLANTESGSSCFFVPRVLPDGERNHFSVQRLKDKLGNRPMPRARSSSRARSEPSSVRRAGNPDDHRHGGLDQARLRPGLGCRDESRPDASHLAPGIGRPSGRGLSISP
jgi:hypothetical protein